MDATEFEKLRKLAGTQREAADLLMVTERTIHRWETGEGKIPRIKWDWIRVQLRTAAKKNGRGAK